MLYQVTVQVNTKRVDSTGTWNGSRQVPTFYVEASGPGEAGVKAREVVNPVGAAEITAVHTTVAPVPALAALESGAR